VALDMSFVDAALALGVPIVGYTLYQDPDGDLPEYFGDALDKYAADAAYLGDLLSPNLEWIAAARPDLILSSKVRHEAMYDQLSAIAPTIMSESAGSGWKDNVLLTAQAVGREDVANQVLADFEERAAAIGADIKSSAGDPVVSVARFLGLDQFRLYQRASFSGVVLDDVGLARPENQNATDPANFIREVSFENLHEAESGADWVFYTIFGNGNPDDENANTGRAAIQSSALWTSLRTVQGSTAIEVSDETWMSAVGLFGAHAILDDLARIFDVDSHEDEN
jgi:iron complex transport system substrate-binding protein